MLGVPVIASDLPVFHEIAGAIPLYLSPLDGLGWKQAILEFAKPDSTGRQAQRERLQGFVAPTWEAHFAVVDELIQRVCR
jgi:hypothetical protein